MPKTSRTASESVDKALGSSACMLAGQVCGPDRHVPHAGGYVRDCPSSTLLS